MKIMRYLFRTIQNKMPTANVRTIGTPMERTA